MKALFFPRDIFGILPGDHFGTILRAFWDHPGFPKSKKHVGHNLKNNLQHGFASLLDFVLNSMGIPEKKQLQLPGGHFGTILRAFWDHPGFLKSQKHVGPQFKNYSAAWLCIPLGFFFEFH